MDDCSSQDVTVLNGTESMDKMRCWPTTLTNSPFHLAAIINPDRAPSDAPVASRVVMFPTISNGSIEWLCGYHNETSLRLPEKYLPAECRSNYVTSTVTIHVGGVDVSSDGLLIE
ncbi:pilin [Parendozoicomonas sp. Alg238-R29]|uniref:pilin n=1 Tax=Parendozoicomonas sp. Alg238-R29 TaxID=2993446 RepID=UPI00248ECCBB|nr:pilin [Parendozoicomonas sp. Alg238-R29]